MEFRIATEQDREAVEWLWDYCFEKREEFFFKWFFSQYCRIEDVLVGQHRNKVMAGLHLVPYSIFLRGAVMPISYIVGLATYPEARGSGIVRRLLQEALVEMRKRGHYVSLLMPSKAGLYYPYHWELCYHNYKYSVNLEDLRPIASSRGELRPVCIETDAAILEKLYQAFVADKHGYAIRGENYWTRVAVEYAGEHGHIYVLEYDGNPEGYVMYVLRDDRIIVREMAFINGQAQKALLQFLYNHWAQACILEWNAPLDDLTYLSLPEPKREVQLFPFMTGRVVDLVQVLEAIDYESDVKKQITLEIKDDLAEWNNGVFVLEVSDGKGKVQALTQSKGEVECTIGVISQLIFGRVSARELVKTGRMVTNFPGNIEILENLFPKCNNYINEYY